MIGLIIITFHLVFLFVFRQNYWLKNYLQEIYKVLDQENLKRKETCNYSENLTKVYKLKSTVAK